MNDGPVRVRGNRTLPLKAQLFNGEGYAITDLDITSPPLIQVILTPNDGSPAQDVTDAALAAGMGSEDHQFEYDPVEQIWQYNLKTKPYQTPGTYTITMVSGDTDEYALSSTCEATFERID